MLKFSSHPLFVGRILLTSIFTNKTNLLKCSKVLAWMTWKKLDNMLQIPHLLHPLDQENIKERSWKMQPFFGLSAAWWCYARCGKQYQNGQIINWSQDKDNKCCQNRTYGWSQSFTYKCLWYGGLYTNEWTSIWLNPLEFFK